LPVTGTLVFTTQMSSSFLVPIGSDFTTNGDKFRALVLSIRARAGGRSAAARFPPARSAGQRSGLSSSKVNYGICSG